MISCYVADYTGRLHFFPSKKRRWLIHWSPLLRSVFCPKKVDLTSGLSLHPGDNLVHS